MKTLTYKFTETFQNPFNRKARAGISPRGILRGLGFFMEDCQMEKIDLIGKNFGRLIVEKSAHSNKAGQAFWKCKCDCGNIIIARSDSLRTGNTKSCGCLPKEILIARNTTHTLSKTGTYKIWRGMISRCRYDYPFYRYWHGKGIKVCDRWMSFKRFLFDMGERPKGLTIERIDSN
ncbi:hypothetical protein LCGC14_2592630, partial [marine sediment metagenome]